MLDSLYGGYIDFVYFAFNPSAPLLDWFLGVLGIGYTGLIVLGFTTVIIPPLLMWLGLLIKMRFKQRRDVSQ